MSDLYVAGGQVISSGALLSDTADLAADAGYHFLIAAGQIPTAPVGRSIAATATAFSRAYGALVDDLVQSATGLGDHVATDGSVYLSVEADVVYRLGGI